MATRREVAVFEGNDDVTVVPQQPAEHPMVHLPALPVIQIEQYLERRRMIKRILKEVMEEGKDKDYGVIPGTDKPTLYKAGAEKLLTFFGLTWHPEPVKVVERWADKLGEEPFFYYCFEAVVCYGNLEVVRYRGLCHSHETKYRWRWVQSLDVPSYLDRDELLVRPGKISEFEFAIRRAETSGKYGKPPEYWQQFQDAIREGRAKRYEKPMGKDGKKTPAFEIDAALYRIPNPEVEDLAHTIQAMAQKRAVVGAVRYATNASDIFEIREDAGEDDDGNGRPPRSEADEIEQRDYQERLHRAEHGSGKSPAPADREDLYTVKKPDAAKAQEDAINAVRKAYGQQKVGKDYPPTDARLAELTARAKSDAKADLLSRTVFDKALTALSHAHVEAFMVMTDEQLTAILGALAAEAAGK